jgi:hypothetical protein
MFRWIQDSPHFLELIYQAVYRSLRPFQSWLLPGSWAERASISLERIAKGRSSIAACAAWAVA